MPWINGLFNLLLHTYISNTSVENNLLQPYMKSTKMAKILPQTRIRNTLVLVKFTIIIKDVEKMCSDVTANMQCWSWTLSRGSEKWQEMVRNSPYEHILQRRRRCGEALTSTRCLKAFLFPCWASARGSSTAQHHTGPHRSYTLLPHLYYDI